MLFLTSTIHQDVIKVDNNKFTNEMLEDLVHEPHKGAWCIGQSEWHHKPFIKASFGFEGGLPFIPLKYPNLIITTP